MPLHLLLCRWIASRGTKRGQLSMIPEGIGRYQAPVRRILQPLVRRLWRFDVEGLHHVPEAGPAVLCPEPCGVHRLALRAGGARPEPDLRRQGRIPRRLEDQAPVSRARDDSHRPSGAATMLRLRSTPPARCCSRGACSGSTRRAPGAGAADSTRAIPVRPDWRSKPVRR